MVLKKVPVDTWMVVDVDGNRSEVVSTHACCRDAEAERDRRNEGLSRSRYSACIAIQPIAERMGRACD